jgi:hypothetical protein
MNWEASFRNSGFAHCHGGSERGRRMQSSERSGPRGPSTDDRVGMPTDDPHRQQHLLTALVGGTHPEIYACTGLCIGVKPYAIGDADGAPPAARCPALFPVARRIVAERPPVRNHCVPRAQDRSGRTHSKSPGLRLRHYDAFWASGPVHPHVWRTPIRSPRRVVASGNDPKRPEMTTDVPQSQRRAWYLLHTTGRLSLGTAPRPTGPPARALAEAKIAIGACSSGFYP